MPRRSEPFTLPSICPSPKEKMYWTEVMNPRRSFFWLMGASSLLPLQQLLAGGPGSVSWWLLLQQLAVTGSTGSSVVTVSVSFFVAFWIRTPPRSPVINARKGRITPKTQPRMLKVTTMLSTPVWGVAMRKAPVAPLLAPSLRRVAATGIVPQEQRGRGMPRETAFKIGLKPPPLR